MILEQFDSNKTAFINPWNMIEPVKDMPKVAVACYAYTTFDRMIQRLHAEQIATTSTANGIKPIYKANYKGVEIGLFMLDVGASMSAALMEDVYQMGVDTMIIFGTCGVLDGAIEDCSIIIPNSAVRDEGTSYHYMKSSDEIEVNENYIEMFKEMLEEYQIHYTEGKVWTTDSIYRETQDKITARKNQGCICVDMECSANAAVAKFREKNLFQFFYAADNLDSEEWDVRSLSNEDKLEEKDKSAYIALEFAKRLAE